MACLKLYIRYDMEIILVAFPNTQFLVSFLYFDVSNFDNCPLLVCLPTAIGDLTYMTCSIFKETMNLSFSPIFFPSKFCFHAVFSLLLGKSPQFQYLGFSLYLRFSTCLVQKFCTYTLHFTDIML